MEIIIEGIGDLKMIVAHYLAMPILTNFANQHSGIAALHKWDEERNKQIDELKIIIKA